MEERLEFFANFFLIPCTRRPVTQYVQFHWAAECVATMNKDYAQLYASVNRIIKTYSRLDQNFTFDMTI